MSSEIFKRLNLRGFQVGKQIPIKKVVHDRGFGFIQAQDGKEIFFHRSSLQQLDFDTLKEGESVEFEVERGDKGPRAINLRTSRA